MGEPKTNRVECHLRQGVADDAFGILEVHRGSILRLGSLAYSEAECLSWAFGLHAKQYVQAMKALGETYWVAEMNGFICGFCSYLGNEVKGLYVHADVARMGIGTRLLEKAETEIFALGHDKIDLTAALSAKGFYRKHGYSSVQEKSWESRGGLEMTVLQMRKPRTIG
ncbi:GNAT family N-acetyltransferase [Neogemmobacter tilapiae]|uniref:N-acetyltransferase domain-containing protein n=1 Tax=Neogemmobacter tilapiae TaxID=875041 RepID=A0A918WIP1_9RHOB|nr:GNAT family N-acetyltransferase [Gemmobacter tilapiae]GHC55177.1 hypothetical protein GCM10007315_17570 [Gemmobacter tilapiae]